MNSPSNETGFRKLSLVLSEGGVPAPPHGAPPPFFIGHPVILPRIAGCASRKRPDRPSPDPGTSREALLAARISFLRARPRQDRERFPSGPSRARPSFPRSLLVASILLQRSQPTLRAGRAEGSVARPIPSFTPARPAQFSLR